MKDKTSTAGEMFPVHNALNSTPSGERVHIALFGRRNVGKSSLINAITGQDTAIVSELKGTTTDPVSKAMEILPIGPVLLIDTPGLDDDSFLGKERIRRARSILNKTNLALVVTDLSQVKDNFSFEKDLINEIKTKNIPYLIVMNKCDQHPESCSPKNFSTPLHIEPDIYVSAKDNIHIHELRELMADKTIRESVKENYLIRDKLQPGDCVVLVIPIDSAAPKGRLILPQQQVIRDILEARATAVVCRDTELTGTLKRLSHPPKLVITDSQAFASVSADTPPDILLTSFSILFSRYKGNLETQLAGIQAICHLHDGNHILIAEGCTHHRQCEDIGTVKIPHWLEKYTGKTFHYHTCSGGQFPDDLSPYQLVVHCGGCTLNNREMAFRIKECVDQNTPIVNYGILIAHLNGILDRSIEIFNKK